MGGVTIKDSPKQSATSEDESENVEVTGGPLEGGVVLANLLDDPDLEGLDGPTRIARKPNPPFLLMHHPNSWAVEVVDGQPTLLPELAPLILLQGCNLVRTLDKDEDRREAYKLAVANRVEEGWTVIPWGYAVKEPTHLPTGVAPGKYIREVPCKDRRTKAKGTFYTEAWNVPVKTPPGRDQVFRFDRAAYNRWRASLVRSSPGAPDGLIDPPLDAVLEEMGQALDERVESVRARYSNPHDREPRVAKAAARREAFDAALEGAA